MTPDFKLYLITDRKLFAAHCSMYLEIETVIEAGVKAIQLREKDLSTRELLDMAHWMRDLTNEYGSKFLINDRVDIALAVKADGVHLGQNSMPASAVRKISGDRLLIGVSTHSIDGGRASGKGGSGLHNPWPHIRDPVKTEIRTTDRH